MKLRNFIGLLLIVIGVAGVIFVYLDRENGGENTQLDKIADRLLEDIDMRKTAEMDNIKDIVIESNGTNVNIVKGSGTEAIVTLRGKVTPNVAKKLNLDVLRTGDKLVIDIDNNGGWFIGVNWLKEGLRVELPETVWNSLTIDAGSGNITMESLEADSLVIDSVSGNVKLSSLNLEKLKLDGGSGNLTFKDIDAGNLIANVGSGNVSLNGINSSSISLEISSGNLKAEQYVAETFTFDISSGNVKLVDGRAKIDGKSSSGEITIEAEDLFYDTTLKTGSGNVKISLDNEPRSLEVDYKGGSGSGTINIDGFDYDHKSNDRDRLEGRIGSGDIKLKVTTGSGNFSLK